MQEIFSSNTCNKMYAPHTDIQVVWMDNLCEKSQESDWDMQMRLKKEE